MQLSPVDPRCSAFRTSHAEVVIAGAGLIGLSLALELQRRGAFVTVLERDHALHQASISAAGMLAVHDPHNPPALLPLSQLSMALYPAFLDRIAALSGITVPFQTEITFQHQKNGGTEQLAERSLDPRQLASALLAAVRKTDIRLIERTSIVSIHESDQGLQLHTDSNIELITGHLIHANGAWTPQAVTPCKGQMLRVRLSSPLTEVHRSEDAYIVPRTIGPQAGTAILGATVEDAGFDTTVRQEDLDRLRVLAAGLLPSLANPAEAPAVEAWAGLRPATPDALPVLGWLHDPRQLVAGGHFRNGILLAPATAVLMADLLEAKPIGIDMAHFNPNRFTQRE